MKPLIFLLATCSIHASAQVLTFGVQGGVAGQPPRGRTESVPFLLGPSVGIHFVSGLSVETGLLYRRIGRGYESYTLLFPENAVTLGSERWRGSALEIPVLAKYRFLDKGAAWRPFLTAGPTVRRTSIRSDNATVVFGNSSLTPNRLPTFNDTSFTHWGIDPTVGAGVDLRAGKFHVEPQVQYSYWTAGKNSSIRKNQTSFLLGFRF
jgi:hypothetical protein